MNKVITLDLVIDNVIFIQQCFVLPITNPIILGSNFLDIHFAVLDISNCIITLYCADYMLTTSLTHDPIDNQNLAKIVALATPEISYKQFGKRCGKIPQNLLLECNIKPSFHHLSSCKACCQDYCSHWLYNTRNILVTRKVTIL